LNKDPKALAASITSRLGNFATKQNLPYPQVLTQFLIERMAARLLQDKSLAKHIIVKGGYVIVRVYNSPRYTVDLDALAQGIELSVAVSKANAAISKSNMSDGVWFVFQNEIDLETQGEYGGIRLEFRSGLGTPPKKLQKAQIINLDLAVGDAVVPQAKQMTTSSILDQGEMSWQVYPPETTVSEKIHALVTRGETNSRSKDIFDINHLLDACKSSLLEKSLAATFESRGDKHPLNLIETLSTFDRTILKRGWKGAVGPLASKFDFEDTFKTMIQKLEKLIQK